MRRTILQLYTHQRAFWLLTGVILVGLVMYFYCINQTVHYVVERKSLENDLARLQARIGSLEFRYIEQRNAITRSTARQLGFRTDADPRYLRRPALGQRGGSGEQL